MVTQLDNELRAANNRIEDLKEKLEEKNDLLSDMASDKTDVVELKKLNARYMAAADGANRDKHELDNTLAVDLAEAIKPILNEHLDPAAKSLSSLQESVKKLEQATTKLCDTESSLSDLKTSLPKSVSLVIGTSAEEVIDSVSEVKLAK